MFVFSPNTGKCGPEKTSYLDTFHPVVYLACQYMSHEGLHHSSRESSNNYAVLYHSGFLKNTVYLKNAKERYSGKTTIVK